MVLVTIERIAKLPLDLKTCKRRYPWCELGPPSEDGFDSFVVWESTRGGPVNKSSICRSAKEFAARLAVKFMVTTERKGDFEGVRVTRVE
jgi:hypothetical protein